MTLMAIRPNPEWTRTMHEKAKRGDLVPACHDRTPHIELRCPCFFVMHVHRSQIVHVPEGARIATPCHNCGDVLEIDRDELLKAMDEAWGVKA